MGVRMRFNEVLTNIAAVALVLLCGRVAAAEQTPSSAANAGSALDTMVEQRMKDAGIVGLGAAIIVNRKVVWTKGYGFADKQHAVPFTPDTIMNIGSISKTFTGVALMRAVQEGKLSFDEDRKSTRLNSSHSQISYAVFCLKKKKTKDSVTRKA